MRRVADGFLAAGDVAEQAAHDFAAAGFRQGVGEADVVGLGQRADFLADVLLEFLAERFARLARLERDEDGDGFALQLVRPADRRRLGHAPDG